MNDIKQAIFSGLNTHFTADGASSPSVLVIEANQSAQKPPYPYITILFGGPYSASQGHTGNIYIGDNGDEDIDYTLARNEIMTLSITSIAESSEDAKENAEQVSKWFNWIGYDDLKEAGAVVSGQEAMTNRDVVIVDDFEKRIGFDIRLRVLSTVTRKESWIGEIDGLDLRKRELR